MILVVGVFAMNIIMSKYLGWGANWTQSNLAFVVGVCWARYEAQLKRLIMRYSRLFYFGALVVFVMLAVLCRMNGVSGYASLIRQNTYGVFVVLIMYLLPLRRYAFLMFLGGLSLEIYLVQSIAFQTVFMMRTGPVVGLVLSIALSIGMAYFVQLGRKRLFQRQGNVRAK